MVMNEPKACFSPLVTRCRAFSRSRSPLRDPGSGVADRGPADLPRAAAPSRQTARLDAGASRPGTGRASCAAPGVLRQSRWQAWSSERRVIPPALYARHHRAAPKGLASLRLLQILLLFRIVHEINLTSPRIRRGRVGCKRLPNGRSLRSDPNLNISP